MSNRNRRRFLQESMLAAAAAAAATGPAHSLLAANAPSKSANEKLGVAIMGTRGRGRSHRDAWLRRADTEILYMVDVDRKVGGQNTEHVASKQKGVKPEFVEDVRKALEDPRVDIVSIATPNHWHALGAIWAIQAGKHVYLEKPVSHNVLEGRRIVEFARANNKIVQTGTQSRSNPGMRDAIAFARKGELGKVKVARGLCYKRRGSIGAAGSYKPPADVNYNLWLGPAPFKAVSRKQFHYDWHWQWNYGNGDLGNQGIHQMDLARWGLGVDTLSPKVFSYGGRFGYVDAGETANTQVVTHDYGDQSLVFEVRGLPTSKYKSAGVGVIFECEDGYVAMNSYSGGAAFDKDGKQIKKFSGGGDHFGNFIDAVRSNKHTDLNADILEGHLSSALCHTGNISYRSGAAVPGDTLKAAIDKLESSDNAKDTLERTLAHLSDNKIDLKSTKINLGPQLSMNVEAENFPGNDKANAMLTREYRKGFELPEVASS